MSDTIPEDQTQTKPASQFNARLPHLTHAQINKLSAENGLTKTQVIIIAVDRLSRDLDASVEGVNKDVRMLRTVSRIVPDLDLGQDG